MFGPKQKAILYIYILYFIFADFITCGRKQQTYDLCDRSKLSAGLCLHCPSGNNDVK